MDVCLFGAYPVKELDFVPSFWIFRDRYVVDDEAHERRRDKDKGGNDQGSAKAQNTPQNCPKCLHLHCFLRLSIMLHSHAIRRGLNEIEKDKKIM